MFYLLGGLICLLMSYIVGLYTPPDFVLLLRITVCYIVISSSLEESYVCKFYTKYIFFDCVMLIQSPGAAFYFVQIYNFLNFGVVVEYLVPFSCPLLEGLDSMKSLFILILGFFSVCFIFLYLELFDFFFFFVDFHGSQKGSIHTQTAMQNVILIIMVVRTLALLL